MTRARLNLLLALAVAVLGGIAFWEAWRPEPAPPTLGGPSEDEVQAIRIENRRGSLRLERAGEHWVIAGTPPLPAAKGRVERLLSLARARIERDYPADRAAPEALGLKPPAATVVWEPAGFRVRIGGTDPVEGLRYVELGDRIALVPAYVTEAALGRPEDFVSRRLLPAGAEPVEIRTPQVHLLRSEGRWRVEGDNEVSQDRIQSLLDEWRHARAIAVERLADGKTPEGLPEWQVRLADGRTLRFLLEDREGQPTRLLRPDLGLAYEISSRLQKALAELPAPPEPADAGEEGDTEAADMPAEIEVESR